MSTTKPPRSPATGTMEPQAFHEALVALGLTRAAAAALWGANERAVRRWCSVEWGQGPPESVVMWVRYMQASRLLPADIAATLEGHYPEHYRGLAKHLRTIRGPREREAL